MTDRELLEAAAKAAGMVGYIREWIHGPYFIVPANPTDPRSMPLSWSPLTDDGDALRLAVRLGINVTRRRNQHGLFVVAEAPGPYLFEAEDITGIEDEAAKCAATRRAITRAAAAMVKEG